MSDMEKFSNSKDESTPKKSKLGLVVVLLVVLVAVVIYLVSGGSETSEEDLIEGLETPRSSLDLFLEHVDKKDMDYIEENTELGDEIDFSTWDDIKNMNVAGINEESDDVSLARVDLEFEKELEDGDVFEYPMTLVFVIEEKDGNWIITGVEYDLKRFNGELDEEVEEEDEDEE